MKIPLSRPDITEKEIAAVQEVLLSHTLSLGPKATAFEEEFCRYLPIPHAVAVNSGTAGLHLLVRALKISRGDEVITTPFSFIASSNCLLYEGATPVFVDIDPFTMNMDPNLIEAKITPRTKALLPVHVFGLPADMPAITSLAKLYHLKMIEDTCEALGTEIWGKKAGTFADGAVFAFYPNKQITTGEGGMIVTTDPEICELCSSMRNQGRGKNSSWLIHERLGYNYRMNELSAALGLVQLNRIEEIIRKRSLVAEAYRQRLEEIPQVIVPKTPENAKISWFVYVIRFLPEIDRDQIMQFLLNHGIDCRPYFPPIHLQPFYQKNFGYRKGDFPITERIASSTLALPFFNNLQEGEIDFVVDTLKQALKKSRKP
ncbi:MAG: DegT/DnrJ/EryC1/StrS family aminotransferase [Bacillota bacterium]|jgi:perosamine synthetase|nr:DegT/DnrJ/EryC1/StrS family aminotransferase [Clostridia bacterium]